MTSESNTAPSLKSTPSTIFHHENDDAASTSSVSSTASTLRSLKTRYLAKIKSADRLPDPESKEKSTATKKRKTTGKGKHTHTKASSSSSSSSSPTKVDYETLGTYLALR